MATTAPLFAATDTNATVLKQSAAAARSWNPATPAPEITIARGYRPGVLARCLEMHMAYYPPLNGWGREFEAGLGVLFGDLLQRLDRPVNEAFCAMRKGRIVGTLFVDGEGAQGAQLRGFIVDDAARGTGVGRRLFQEAMGFVREAGFRECRLVTMRRLGAARRLYEEAGFREVAEREKVCWGVRVGELEYLWTREAGGK